jgi:hypothetical protein
MDFEDKVVILYGGTSGRFLFNANMQGYLNVFIYRHWKRIIVCTSIKKVQQIDTQNKGR